MGNEVREGKLCSFAAGVFRCYRFALGIRFSEREIDGFQNRGDHYHHSGDSDNQSRVSLFLSFQLKAARFL
jgi:hypothetical protein